MAFDKERKVINSKRCETLFPLHEIDSYNGEELKKHISAIVDEIDAFVIDFSKVVYLNSSGLRELIQIMKMSVEKNKYFYLSRISEDIKKIFIHTNLDKLFVFSDTLQEAFDEIGGAGGK